MSSEIPSDLLYLKKKMSEAWIRKFRAEFDEPLINLAGKVTEGKVIEYLYEIEKTKSPPLKELADALGSKGEVAQFLYYVDADNRNYLKNYTKPDEPLRSNPGAVLLSQDIEDLCNKNIRRLPLIDPLDENNLEGASYKLSLGSRHWVDKEPDWLTEKKPKLTIPPHGIAIVSTYEWLNMPVFLIARWNLKVRKVYSGLVWVGGPQVDPGYQGFLSCPLYNLSNKEQVLYYKEPLFTIDFVRTTPFDPKRGKLWSGLDKDRLSTFDFKKRLVEDKIESAPEHLTREVDRLKREIRQAETAGIVILSVVIAVVGTIVGFGATKIEWSSGTIISVLVGVALLTSLAALIRSFFGKRG